MALEIKQSLKLTQQLVMTPQLQQAIKLLQLNRMELVDLVAAELQENPVLDEVAEYEEELEPKKEPQAAEAAPEAPAPEKGSEIDWDSYLDTYSNMGYKPGDYDEDRPSLESTLVKKTSLADHLLWQLKLSSLDPLEQALGAFIIGNLNEDGYLEETLDHIAEIADADMAQVEEVLRRIQEFDPVGIAARDLSECLLIQLRQLALSDCVAEEIAEKYLNRLERKDYRGIAKEIGIPIEKVVEAAKIISNLEPRPGRPFSQDEPFYITPDIYVHKVGDDYIVILNEDGMPKLKISPFYRDVLHGGTGTSKVTKEYIQEKLRSAVWLIKSIHQRQRTIYKVMTSIVKFQRDFFDKGINCLKPLNLRDVAEDIGMHESTISRVTTNKYVHTPQGIYELKFFFNSGINLVGGEHVASEAVKDKIRKIISSENPRRPLSDQKIVEILKQHDIEIARRTVTKYREILGMLSSTKRKGMQH
ncbi:MAG: RNA polymerase sigma-54 factor [Deltaproteobacteria bacterium RBG_13_65_10]|nr:MAG: RNA polymerase sigma-54 factor [Deltaproteobacteria bacterium RBG_13_65_10]